MQRVLNHIENRAAEVSRHPFIQQLNSVTADGAYTVLSNFALSFVHLSLTFRDINELYFSYDQPKDELERIVDSHARADAEHWKFLFEDLEALGVNQQRSATQYIERFWRPEDTYIRKYIYSVLARAGLWQLSHQANGGHGSSRGRRAGVFWCGSPQCRADKGSQEH